MLSRCRFQKYELSTGENVNWSRGSNPRGTFLSSFSLDSAAVIDIFVIFHANSAKRAFFLGKGHMV